MTFGAISADSVDAALAAAVAVAAVAAEAIAAAVVGAVFELPEDCRTDRCRGRERMKKPRIRPSRPKIVD